MSLKELASRVPVIRASGRNYEIGFAHGRGGKSQIDVTIENLKRSVKDGIGCDWEICMQIAKAFIPAVKAYNPQYLEEIQGIADGAGYRFEDIFTLNCRTELGQQFVYQKVLNFGNAMKLAGGCSVIGANYSRTKTKTTIYGQNWDANPSQRDTLIFVIARQTDKPDIAWIGEAGLICRMAGINSSGIGLGGNSLFTNAPVDFEGVPLQFVYRGIMDQSAFPDAVEMAAQGNVASNINFMICGPEGEMVNMETEYKGYGMLYMKNGLISHANTYRHSKLPKAPYQEVKFPRDELRDFRLAALVDGLNGNDITMEDLKEILSDHRANYPDSICQHTAEFATVFSTVCDLNTLQMDIAVGNPCGGYVSVKPFEEE